MTVLPQLMMPGGAAGAIQPFIEFHSSTDTYSTSAGGDFTFSNAPIGAAPTGGKRRFVFIYVAGTDGNGQQVDIAGSDSCTIDGATALTGVVGVVKNTSNYEAFGGILYKEVATGSTATIVAKWEGSPTISNRYIGVVSILTGPGGFDVYDIDWEAQTGNSTAMTEIQNVVEGGALIGGACVKAGNITMTNVATIEVGGGTTSGTPRFETCASFGLSASSPTITAAKSQSTTGMLAICSLRPL